MGTLVGHVAPGFAFLVLGFWHFFNQIKLHYSLHPNKTNNFYSSPWFPHPRIRYMELYFIMVYGVVSIVMELLVGPKKHHPFDTDGTIPSNHLHNIEHALMSLVFFVYAILGVMLDKICPKSRNGLTLLIGAMAFAQEYLLFFVHSTDHVGVEGQYHWLLRLVIFVSLATTLLGIGFPKSFLVGFVRSFSVLFQGVWIIILGFMLYIPRFMPKGCFINIEDAHQVVRCHSEEALSRAKSLTNIEFCLYLMLMTIFSVWFYLFVVGIYSKKDVGYSSLTKEEEEDVDLKDIEFQKPSNNPKTTTAY